jgi:hypothetical protein
MNGFPSPPTNMHWYLTIKPGLHPPGQPFVLNGWSESRLPTSLCMEVNNAKLLKFLEAVYSNLLCLIMQLIALCKAIAARLSTEAQHGPEILRQLGNRIWNQLMQLHLKLQQDFYES